jgi:hypothetical protein
VDTKEDGNVYAEQFKIYGQFAMTYDADKDELYYNGKAVRWFEDYYSLGDCSKAGRDYFNEKGVVDVYAVRDLSGFVRANDGSFDPSGKLTGLEEFSEEEFAARDIEAILTSNGESLGGGRINGAIRTFGNGNGTVDIYTVRDYHNLNASGYGTLTGIVKYSQEEFDEHTRTSNAPTLREFR